MSKQAKQEKNQQTTHDFEQKELCSFSRKEGRPQCRGPECVRLCPRHRHVFLRGTLRPLVLPLRALRPEPLGGQALEQPAFFCPLVGRPDACGPAPARPRASSGTVAIPAVPVCGMVRLNVSSGFSKKYVFYCSGTFSSDKT